MKTPVFTGASTALITPFSGGAVDYPALDRLLSMQSEAGCRAVTVCGTTGEAATLTQDEQSSVIAFTAAHSRGMKVVAGVGTNDTAATIRRAKLAAELGADAVLVVTPYYNKPTQTGLTRHFTAVADNAIVPVILYNVPSRTGVAMSAEMCCALSRHPNINGIKEASGSLALVTDILRNADEGFTVWSGDDDLTVPMMSLGAKGVISVLGNIAPEAVVRMTECCLDGCFSEAAELHRRWHPLMRALFAETNPIPVKAAASMLGLARDELRLPLSPASNKTRELLSPLIDKLTA